LGESAKYRRALAALPQQTGHTLELGCGDGVFAAMLAPRCESLLVVDLSLWLPEQIPAGPFETIACVDAFYDWGPQLVLDGLVRLERALESGGTLIAVHGRGGRGRRLDGDGVHRILRERAGLRWEAGVETPDYLLDRWSGKARGPSRS
jgi:hypothetical protein